ncbi:hypothetical protein [Thalassoglobus polymorphus]|uniref:Uncharacterized protein n=1 Tax=Thalassoglobus polymorphus TaxID=2527994 RepID=A0A517QRZ6_9PLAN|nr:hypothetical protein [Thalassoglobus polymorphus]QDT34379.1 hypothetical protein Mal48_36390 [Thalassoglobus polymorphus]
MRAKSMKLQIDLFVIRSTQPTLSCMLTKVDEKWVQPADASIGIDLHGNYFESAP